MDKSLFSRIENLIKNKTNEKEEIISYIKKELNIEIKEDQIEIKDKKINLYLNSNQKLIFIKNKGKETLEKKGYKTNKG
jgi:hypothetical protein